MNEITCGEPFVPVLVVVMRNAEGYLGNEDGPLLRRAGEIDLTAALRSLDANALSRVLGGVADPDVSNVHRIIRALNGWTAEARSGLVDALQERWPDDCRPDCGQCDQIHEMLWGAPHRIKGNELAEAVRKLSERARTAEAARDAAIRERDEANDRIDRSLSVIFHALKLIPIADARAMLPTHVAGLARDRDEKEERLAGAIRDLEESCNARDVHRIARRQLATDLVALANDGEVFTALAEAVRQTLATVTKERDEAKWQLARHKSLAVGVASTLREWQPVVEAAKLARKRHAVDLSRYRARDGRTDAAAAVYLGQHLENPTACTLADVALWRAVDALSAAPNAKSVGTPPSHGSLAEEQRDDMASRPSESAHWPKMRFAEPEDTPEEAWRRGAEATRGSFAITTGGLAWAAEHPLPAYQPPGREAGK